MLSLVYVVTEGPQVGWASTETFGLTALAVVLFAAFIIVEIRAVTPLVPLVMLRQRALAAGNVIMLVAGAAVDGLLLVLTLYAQEVLNYTAIEYGLALAVMTVASIAASYAAQHFIGRIGVRRVACAGMVLIGAACILLSTVRVNGTFLEDLLPALVLFGLGMGASYVAGSIASLSGASEDDSGAASGLQTTSFTVGNALGVAFLSTVASACLGPVRELGALTTGYRAAFSAAALLAAAGLIAALALPATKSKRKLSGSQ
ncbi:MFS transporter [Amycolatopsis plumensis]|uniref:MFS transporter n=1 Tax=Amycolatopsis plumensis TaxID=236508 RepID=UPI0036120016